MTAVPSSCPYALDSDLEPKYVGREHAGRNWADGELSEPHWGVTHDGWLLYWGEEVFLGSPDDHSSPSLKDLSDDWYECDRDLEVYQASKIDLPEGL